MPRIPEPDQTPDGPAYEGRLLARADEVTQKKYREGGLAALSTKFASGRPTTLSDQQMMRLYSLIEGNDPRQYSFAVALWTRGIIRDLIANEVPEVMYRSDVLYATAAAAGAFTVWWMHWHYTPFQSQLCGSLVVIALRWISRRGWVRLPVRRLPDR